MKDNFTEQQREIVARKMGFDGPMQNFGEFLMSSPATANQYAAVASKLGEKAQAFAAGGMPQQNAVKKGATTIFKEYMATKTDEDIQPALDIMQQRIKDKKGVLLRDRNTVMFVDLQSAQRISTVIGTTDVEPTLSKSLSLLIKQVVALNIKKVYGVEENEELKQAYSANGFTITESDIPDLEWCALLK